MELPQILFTLPHTHPFNGPFSGTTRVSQYQKGKTNLDFTEARDREWQWHQLGHIQVCISLQTDNHASTPPVKFFYSPDALPAAQPTVSKHWRQFYSHCHHDKNQQFCHVWLSGLNWGIGQSLLSFKSFSHTNKRIRMVMFTMAHVNNTC